MAPATACEPMADDPVTSPPGSGRTPWRRFAGVRVRTTAAATLVVGVALAIGALLLVAQQRESLTDSVETAARLRAGDIARFVVDASVPEAITVPPENEGMAQVVDRATGEVVASSANLAGRDRISDLDAPVGRTRAETIDRLPVGEGAFRVVARGVETTGGRFLVYSAASLEPVEESGATLGGLLVTWLPVLLVVVALVSWVVVGWALRPVERIRAEVAGIGDRELDRRVPEPGSGDEIDRLATTMNAMLGRLETAVDRQRRFVADASHELRSPLSVMRADLEVDLAHPERAEWQRTEREVLDETLRLERLVDDLLVLARADAGSLAVPDLPVDLDEIVLEEATRSRAATGVTIDVSQVSGAQTRGDPLSLRRVVRNLLDNGRDHARTTVRVQLREHGDQVVLVVTDDGPGVANDDRTRIFERFARVDDARDRERGGAGLGLAIVREVVEAHRGDVAVTDAAVGSSGARFVVRLPSSGA